METYHKIIVAVAVSILLLYLLTIGFMMRRDDSEKPWPPVAGRCPDGWKEDKVTEQCHIPESGLNRGILDANGNPDLIRIGLARIVKNPVDIGKNIIPNIPNTQITILESRDKDRIFGRNERNGSVINKGDLITITIKNLNGSFDLGTYKVEAIGNFRRRGNGEYEFSENERKYIILNGILGLDNGTEVEYKKSIIMFKNMPVCTKYKWAKPRGIQWDGVTNYNKCK